MLLNPFYDLLSFQTFAPTLIRLALGIFVLSFGVQKIRGDKERLTFFFDSLSLRPAIYYVKTLAIAEVVLGILLIIGLMTQISAIITAIIMLVSFVVAIRNEEVKLEKPSLYALLFILAMSLLLTGAGQIAIDLPL